MLYKNRTVFYYKIPYFIHNNVTIIKALQFKINTAKKRVNLVFRYWVVMQRSVNRKRKARRFAFPGAFLFPPSSLHTSRTTPY